MRLINQKELNLKSSSHKATILNNEHRSNYLLGLGKRTENKDYCSTLVSLPYVWPATSRGLSARGIPRTGHVVSAFMLDVLHWLPQRGLPLLQPAVLVPCSRGVSWVLLRPTSEIFAVPPRAPEVAVHSSHWKKDYSLFLLLVPPQPRPVHSRWLAPMRLNGPID